MKRLLVALQGMNRDVESPSSKREIEEVRSTPRLADHREVWAAADHCGQRSFALD